MQRDSIYTLSQPTLSNSWHNASINDMGICRRRNLHARVNFWKLKDSRLKYKDKNLHRLQVLRLSQITHTHTHTHTFMHIHTHIHTSTRTRTLTHSLTHTHTHTPTHIPTHTHTHTHIHTHTHMHTHICQKTGTATGMGWHWLVGSIKL